MINPSAEVRLQVHKFLGAPVSATPPDGTQQTVSGRDRVAGVSFNVYRVGSLDLTTNAGWLAASALSGHQVTAAEIAAGKVTVGGVDYPLVSQGTVVTDASGVAVFTKPNGVGLYLVSEVLAAGSYPCPPDPYGTVVSTCYKNVDSGAPIRPHFVTRSAPFLVTLPLTNPAGATAQSSWLYDVHVYPKNNAETITKTVQDKWTVAQRSFFKPDIFLDTPLDPNDPIHGIDGMAPDPRFIYPEFNGKTFLAGTATNHPEAAAGKDEIIYTLTSSISAGLTGPQMARYEVKDQLFQGLAFDSVSVKITNATAAGAEKVLTAPTDYTVSVTNLALSLCNNLTPDWGSNPCLQDVKVSMTAAGLVELAAAKAANPAAQVVTVIKTKLVGVPMHRMSISNVGANFVPSQAWLDQQNYPADTMERGKGIGAPAVYSEYFGVKIIKKDPTVAADAQPALTGAEFALFAGGDPVARKCVASDLVGKQPVATAVVTNKKPDGSDLTSGVGFNATMITGLKSSNSFNGEVQIPESRRSEYLSYCLVETKAPAGYTLNPEPIYVEGLRRNTGNSHEYGPLTYTHVSVANQKANLGNQLPLTGGAGAAALGIAGVLLIGGGIGYYTITARRRRS